MRKILFKTVIRPIEVFFNTESASGILLGLCALAAMLVANSSLSTHYFQFLQSKLFGLSVQHWINDGLMTVFFFLIGMEIKRELVIGELSTIKKAVLPFAAAIGGMVVPAVTYSYFNTQAPDSNGWGIPMATDIAFALGVLSLFGSRVPLSLKIFLLALAIVDDLGAVLVISFFYTTQVSLMGLGAAAVAFALTLLGRKRGYSSYSFYLILGIGAWAGFLYSGVHATIAGVIIGLITPLDFQRNNMLIETYSPLNILLHKLHPWVSFGIMPIFAFTNAGISIEGVEFFKIILNPVHQGVALGLLVGKPVGIFLFSKLAVYLGLATLPKGLRWGHILGTGFLGGVGFTMALFISSLALTSDQEIYSKTGIIVGSLGAGLLGSVVLIFSFSQDEKLCRSGTRRSGL